MRRFNVYAKKNSSNNASHNWSNNSYFFPGGHSNEFSNLIGSLRYPDFPNSSHGPGNGFVLLLAKPSKCNSFFQNSFLLDKKLESQKLSPQNRFLLQY